MDGQEIGTTLLKALCPAIKLSRQNLGKQMYGRIHNGGGGGGVGGGASNRHCGISNGGIGGAQFVSVNELLLGNFCRHRHCSGSSEKGSSK